MRNGRAKGANMPKQYINFPEPERVVHAMTEEEYVAGEGGIEVLPALPQIGLHWDGVNEVVQLSFDMDADVLSRIADTRNALHPDHSFVEKQGRAVFYSGALSRDDMQRLIRHARRARDAVFGSDE